MSPERVRRIGRRALVLAMTLAVIGIGVGTVKVATDWRAASAPLDASPVGMDAIASQITATTARATSLSDQLNAVSQQISTLQDAVAQADQHVSGDTTNAQSVKQALDDAKQKLADITGQLQAAQVRLAALNAAAARQAALNAAGGAATTTTQAAPTAAITPEPHD